MPKRNELESVAAMSHAPPTGDPAKMFPRSGVSADVSAETVSGAVEPCRCRAGVGHGVLGDEADLGADRARVGDALRVPQLLRAALPSDDDGVVVALTTT